MIGTQIFWGTGGTRRAWRGATNGRVRRVGAVLRALVVGIVAGVGSCAALMPATAAAAGSCPNEQVRIEEPYAPALPDCRAYEQVSPVEKNYADALGAVTSVRAAHRAKRSRFDSLGVFPLGGGSSGEGSSQLFSAYLSARGAEGWPTQYREPGTNPGASASPVAVTEDLAYTFELSSDEPPLSSNRAWWKAGRRSTCARTARGPIACCSRWRPAKARASSSSRHRRGFAGVL